MIPVVLPVTHHHGNAYRNISETPSKRNEIFLTVKIDAAQMRAANHETAVAAEHDNIFITERSVRLCNLLNCVT